MFCFCVCAWVHVCVEDGGWCMGVVFVRFSVCEWCVVGCASKSNYVYARDRKVVCVCMCVVNSFGFVGTLHYYFILFCLSYLFVSTVHPVYVRVTTSI